MVAQLNIERSGYLYGHFVSVIRGKRNIEKSIQKSSKNVFLSPLLPEWCISWVGASYVIGVLIFRTDLKIGRTTAIHSPPGIQKRRRRI
ncbi:hypothetical protein TNCT_343901 [Trichonephila clavata]|uniref:Uncharacterized protein n=1 Tax=Trichonephila clavata TaxID=2740835 RepID=A0A8X6M2V0_TRICU|nr:hypothetical protein TNCT_343901 [Trichonephila clavata]